MLPQPHRLRMAADFRAVMRFGVRAGRASVVVHARAFPPSVDRTTGPRFGLVVSKAVGNSVQRHRMSRRLRHICADLLLPEYEDIDFVVRALPPALAADHPRLRSEVLEAGCRAAEKAHRRLNESSDNG
ncbi:MAG TPA: ribonuclease P protein component [Dietzia timorensis]|uniref:Ribonuclease P protein component n=1 Tax=Dietzia timorensis TaxID=499555 RepID=A0A921F4X5_9ACTN|nr:ribonuclease P protein component [Dietzia timorensis]HJE90179.1 ribonuclease P protein component [Dietzia timorensis]